MPVLNDQSDAESTLVERLRSGDPAAYRWAVAQYTPVMLAMARNFCDPATAEDVVQDCWVTVIDAIAGFEGRSSLKTWLCTIAANRARDHLRRDRREVRIDVEDLLEPEFRERFDGNGHWRTGHAGWDEADGDPLHELERRSLEDCLDRHIARLPDQQRAVLILRDFQQMSSAEVCNLLGLSESNSRVMLHRARQRMFLMIERFRETGQC